MLFKVKECVGGSALDGRVLMWNKIKHHCHTSTSSSFSLHKKGERAEEQSPGTGVISVKGWRGKEYEQEKIKTTKKAEKVEREKI